MYGGGGLGKDRQGLWDVGGLSVEKRKGEIVKDRQFAVCLRRHRQGRWEGWKTHCLLCLTPSSNGLPEGLL